LDLTLIERITEMRQLDFTAKFSVFLIYLIYQKIENKLRAKKH